jgi:cytochrome P450
LSTEAQLAGCPQAGSAANAGGVPDHVPSDLVRRPTQFDESNTLADPFSISEGVFEDLPPVFYWPKVRPGITQGFWVVTHYDDVREVLQNTDLYSNQGAVNFPSLVGETFRMIPLAIDPPEHSIYRILLNPWFSPKSVTELEPRIYATVNGLIDSFADQGGCDVAYDFARVYPVRVFLDLMGMPQEQLDEFLTWEYAILHSTEQEIDHARWGVAQAIAYLRSFIAEVREHPAENLTSKIVHGSVEGRPLTDDEIIGTVFFLWIGGLDTVAATSALIFRRLALQPLLQQRLRENPDLIPDAIEEFLRVQPITNSSRIAKSDHQIRGVTIRAGDRVMGLNLSGNFDPQEFECPRELKFDRASNRHFTFGGGPHRCLGSHLARREIRIAISEFLRRVPPFALKSEEAIPVYPSVMATTTVPVVWDAAQVA